MMSLRIAVVVAGLAFGFITEHAQAAVVAVSFEADNGSVVVADGSFTYDISKTGLLGYSDLQSFSYTNPRSTYDLAYTLSGGFSEYYYLGFDATSKSFVTTTVNGYPEVLTAIKTGLNDGFYTGTENNKYVTTYDPYVNYPYTDLKFTVSTVSSVPLPASAPMFGAALLGLAGLGFAAKRKKTAAAA